MSFDVGASLSWPPPMHLLRQATAEDAQRYAVLAEERVLTLVGRSVVRESAAVLGALAAAGLIEEPKWRARLVAAAHEAGHANVEAAVAAGMSVYDRGARDKPRTPAGAAALPDAASLLRDWQSGRLTKTDVWAVVDAACRRIRATKREPDALRRIRRRVKAESEAAALVGMLVACGITHREWAVDAVVDASRAAGGATATRRSSVEESMCRGIAAAWQFIKHDEIWDHLESHGYDVSLRPS